MEEQPQDNLNETIMPRLNHGGGGFDGLIGLWEKHPELLERKLSPLATVVLGGADLNTVKRVFELTTQEDNDDNRPLWLVEQNGVYEWEGCLTDAIKFGCQNLDVLRFLARRTHYKFSYALRLWRESLASEPIVKILAEEYYPACEDDDHLDKGDYLDHAALKVLAMTSARSAPQKCPQVGIFATKATCTAWSKLFPLLLKDQMTSSLRIFSPVRFYDEDKKDIQVEAPEYFVAGNRDEILAICANSTIEEVVLHFRREDAPHMFTPLFPLLIKLPKLTIVKIDFREGGIEHIVPNLCQMLALNRLQQLIVNPARPMTFEGPNQCFHPILDSLKTNTSLLKLTLGGVPNNELEAYKEHVTEVLQHHNTSLAKIRFPRNRADRSCHHYYESTPCDSPFQTNLAYLVALNFCGRETVRNKPENPCTVQHFVKLLGLHGALPKADPHNKFNLQFGLLRENPSLWCNTGSAERLAGRKRKAITPP